MRILLSAWFWSFWDKLLNNIMPQNWCSARENDVVWRERSVSHMQNNNVRKKNPIWFLRNSFNINQSHFIEGVRERTPAMNYWIENAQTNEERFISYGQMLTIP